MPTLSIDEVQARLPEVIDQLRPGEEVVITRDDRPIARLSRPPLPKGVPILGRGKGMLISYDEADEHLKDFAEYMP